MHDRAAPRRMNAQKAREAARAAALDRFDSTAAKNDCAAVRAALALPTLDGEAVEPTAAIANDGSVPTSSVHWFTEETVDNPAFVQPPRYMPATSGPRRLTRAARALHQEKLADAQLGATHGGMRNARRT
jgi:hypothetical protein